MPPLAGACGPARATCSAPCCWPRFPRRAPCRRHSVAAALALSLLAGSAAAQPSPAALRGRVVDPSGGRVPQAIVILKGPAGELTLVTGADGGFQADALPPGEYLVAAAAPGFAAASQSVNLASGRTVRVELALQVAGLTEAIEVVADRITGTAARLARIPGSAEILGRETLEAANVFSANEALRKAAGVTVRDEEGLGLRPNIGIRGTNPTRSTRVLLLEDGIPLTYAPYGDNASYYHPPIERFESIEILKGAGQIAYGPMTVGGVINYVTPQPPRQPTGLLALRGGTRRFLSGQGAFGATTGRVGYLVDYLRKQSDGARDHVSSKLDDANAKAVVRLSPAHTLTARASVYAEDSTVTYSGLREDEWRANPRGNPFVNDVFVADRTGTSVTHLYAPAARAALTTTAYHSSFRRHWWRQSSNSGQRPNDAADPACGGMANLNTTCGNEGRLRSYLVWGVEPRAHVLHRFLGVETESTLGVRLHHERQDRLQKNGDFPTARDGRVVEDNLRLNTAVAAFVQQRLRFGALTVTPGVRLEHVAYARTNRLRGVTGETALTEIIPGIGIAHAPSARVSWFAGLHRGFAPPRTEDIIDNDTGGVVDLDPERSWNVELGARTQVRPGLAVDATFFHMDYENQVVPASVAGGVGATLTNAGQTRHQGLEASIRLDTAPLLGTSQNGWVRAALTWLPVARFEGPRYSSIAGFRDVLVTGNRLPYAPERLATVAVGYAWGDHADGSIELVHVGDQFGDDLNTVTGTPDGQRGLLPAHTTWNASFNYRLRVRAHSLALFVAVKNVFDTLYIADRSRGLLPGPPRLVQAGVRLRF